jgi:hypothetical protein
MNYKTIFKEIIKEKHGMDINFEQIENKLQHVRAGKPLSYEDLLIISDDSCWPFNQYWMWPARKQVENELEKTEGWFKELIENKEVEVKVIGGLDEIFKNISLVSIILRFVLPNNYAIYSRPPLKILRVERGANDIEEYLNYIKTLDLLKGSFKVQRMADLDIIVWTIAEKKGEHSRKLNKLLSKHLPENLKPGELINLLSNNPLKIADCYLKQGDWRTAGYYAACFYEKIKDQSWMFTEKIYKKIRYLRTKAIHDSEDFTKNDAREFIKKLKEVKSFGVF